MTRLGSRDNRHERPYLIEYSLGDRVLRDSGRSLEDAVSRCDARLAKPRNRNETCRIYLRGQLVQTVSRDNLDSRRHPA